MTNKCVTKALAGQALKPRDCVLRMPTPGSHNAYAGNCLSPGTGMCLNLCTRTHMYTCKYSYTCAVVCTWRSSTFTLSESWSLILPQCTPDWLVGKFPGTFLSPFPSCLRAVLMCSFQVRPTSPSWSKSQITQYFQKFPLPTVTQAVPPSSSMLWASPPDRAIKPGCAHTSPFLLWNIVFEHRRLFYQHPFLIIFLGFLLWLVI